jgi:nucleoside-diphosphate-sugar epimerase
MTARVLITGAQGLLGGVLARTLARRGYDVVATGRRPGAAAEYEYRACELSDPEAVRALFAGTPFDAVVHSAARVPDGKNEIAPFLRDNVRATAVLAEAARVAEARRFVFCSTISVYSGDGPFAEDAPTDVADPYGSTKRKGEEACLAGNARENRNVVLRLGGLHGHPRVDGVLHAFFTRAARGEPIEVSEPETRATITFFDDVIAIVERILGAAAAPPSPIYNVATSEQVTLRDLAEQVRAQLTNMSRIVSPPASKARNRVLAVERARRELGFAPLPLAEHLARYAAALSSGAVRSARVAG